MTWNYQTQVSPVLDVLFCALRDPVPQADLAFKARKLGGDDWRLLADQAINHHRVGPRVWGALKAAACDVVPPDITTQFKAETRQAAIHALASKAETARVAKALNESGIVPCLLKGWALEENLFGEIGQRVTRDLDLLIREEEVVTAFDSLQILGYSCALPVSFRSNSALQSFMHFAHHLTFFRTTSQTMIELHTRAFRNEHLLPLDTLQTEPKALKVADVTAQIRVPTLAWNFVYLALHGYVHRWERAKWLVDMPHLLHRLSSSDWQWIYQQSHRLGIERTLGIALVLSRDFLLADIPAPAQMLLDRADGTYLAAACRRELLAVEPYANRPTFGRWLESHVINLRASFRLSVMGAALRSLIVRESDVLPSDWASKFIVLHYLSAALHIPRRIGQRVMRRIL